SPHLNAKLAKVAIPIGVAAAQAHRFGHAGAGIELDVRSSLQRLRPTRRRLVSERFATSNCVIPASSGTWATSLPNAKPWAAPLPTTATTTTRRCRRSSDVRRCSRRCARFVRSKDCTLRETCSFATTRFSARWRNQRSGRNSMGSTTPSETARPPTNACARTPRIFRRRQLESGVRCTDTLGTRTTWKGTSFYEPEVGTLGGLRPDRGARRAIVAGRYR